MVVAPRNFWTGHTRRRPCRLDGPLDKDGDGYTNIEGYLNGPTRRCLEPA